MIYISCASAFALQPKLPCSRRTKKFPMQLAPLLNSLPPIPSHARVAIGALGIGTAQLIRTKGTKSHRVSGWILIVPMVYVADSVLFIHEIKSFGKYSPIHALSLVALASLFAGVPAIRRRKIRTHQMTMTILFLSALVATGLFTLYPGRTMHQVLFG